MLNWYFRYKERKAISKLYGLIITVDNYHHISTALKYLSESVQLQTLPANKRYIVSKFNSTNGIELVTNLETINRYISKGDSINITFMKTEKTLDDWLTASGGKSIRVKDFVEETINLYTRLERYLDDMGSNDPVEAEYYINKISPTLIDIITICKLLIK